MTELDHITVAAATLDDGVAYVREALGVELPDGGAHPRMATHNRLLRLGDGVFLEVIAIDPAAPPPARPRWFQLDDPGLRLPRLVTWVVRTTEIAEVLLASRRPLGAIEPMTRGDLRWLITIPDDGSLVDGGMMPTVIQWPAGPHPTSRMQDRGCRLERLEAVHPDVEGYRADLASIGAERQIEISGGERPRLVAKIRTPAGLRTLL